MLKSGKFEANCWYSLRSTKLSKLFIAMEVVKKLGKFTSCSSGWNVLIWKLSKLIVVSASSSCRSSRQLILLKQPAAVSWIEVTEIFKTQTSRPAIQNTRSSKFYCHRDCLFESLKVSSYRFESFLCNFLETSRSCSRDASVAFPWAFFWLTSRWLSCCCLDACVEHVEHEWTVVRS